MSMAARPKRAAEPGEPATRPPGLLGVPGVRGLCMSGRGMIWELRREGVVKEPERVSESVRVRLIDSEGPIDF